MPAMDMLAPAVATPFEVFAAVVSAVVYLGVGTAAMLRAPRDVRARVFFATAIASAAPYSVTALLRAGGAGATLMLPVMVLVGLSLMLGSLALFHFTQVFPWRRPWIRAHWRWLLGGYVLAPLVLAVPVWMLGPFIQEFTATSSGAGGLGAVSVGLSESLALLLLVIPALFFVGLAVPFGALLSLYKSWLAAKAAGVESARVTTLWILISQMGGGVLTILIVPLVHFVAPTGPLATIAAVLLFAFGLLMPLAFAAGVWKYDVLALDPDAPPSRL
jgi:hypothetical protein